MADDRLITNALDAVQLLAEQGRQLRADLNRAQQMAQYWRTSYNMLREEWRWKLGTQAPETVPDPAAGLSVEDMQPQDARRAEAAAPVGDTEYRHLRTQLTELEDDRERWKGQAETNTRLLHGEVDKHRASLVKLGEMETKLRDSAAEVMARGLQKALLEQQLVLATVERATLLKNKEAESERANKLQSIIDSLVHAADHS